jgi:hypothetical protein
MSRGSLDNNYSSIGMDLWSQLRHMIGEKSFLQKWLNEQTQSVTSFFSGLSALSILAVEIGGEALSG